MNKVAITGASGFIGSHLVEVLRKDRRNKIKLLTHKKNSLFDLPTLTKFVKDQDLIFHLAGINDSTSAELFKVNVLGTLNVLEAMRISGSRARLVFTSSFSVYKIPKKGTVVDESFKVFPKNAYGISKHMAENIITFYSKIYGLRSSIARLTNVYGPKMPPFKHSVIATFISLSKSNKEMILTGDGSQTRDFIYIEDAVRALLVLAKSKKNFVIANVCSGAGISLNEIVKYIDILTKKESKVRYIKAKQSDLGYWKGKSILFKYPFYWKPKISFERGLKKIWQGKS